MSEITDLLWLKAQDMEKSASAQLDEWQMIKSAAIQVLESRGITDADDLMERLADKAYPDLASSIEKAASLRDFGAMLEKTASYVSELEAKLSGKEEEVEQLHKKAEDAVKAPSVETLSGTGAFTSADMDMLNTLGEDTLSKVASLTDSTPRNIGGPSTRPGSEQDALTEFLLS